MLKGNVAPANVKPHPVVLVFFVPLLKGRVLKLAKCAIKLLQSLYKCLLATTVALSDS